MANRTELRVFGDWKCEIPEAFTEAFVSYRSIPVSALQHFH